MNEIAPRWLIFTLASVLLASCEIEAAPPVTRINLLSSTNSFGEACIPYSEFNLNKVATEAPLSAVVNLLGEPQRRLSVAPDSDIPVSAFVYPGLIVYHFNEKVAELYATDSMWETPSGLHVGLTDDELINILGRVPTVTDRYDDPVAYEIPVCDQSLSSEVWTATIFVILLNDEGVVTALSIEREWP